MDDSRVGAFGVTAAVLDILIRYSVLSGLPAGKLTGFLLLPPVVGRYLMTWSLFAFPAARQAGLGWFFKQGASLMVFAGTTVLAMALIYSIAGFSGLIITASTWVIITLGGLFCKARLGGLTGDTCGALNELAELSVLLIYSSLLYNKPVGY
jgi:adenosylcobinamide-GDP ribazoletransferase